MEKIANAKRANEDKPLRLLRGDSYNYNGNAGGKQEDSLNSSSYSGYGYDDDDEKILVYPKLESALPAFYNAMADYADHFEIDAISSELGAKIDASKTLNRIVHTYGLTMIWMHWPGRYMVTCPCMKMPLRR